jgi:flagellar biogenesis protein FliO
MRRAVAQAIVAGVVLLAPVMTPAESARSARATRAASRPPALETPEPSVATPAPTPAPSSTHAPVQPSVVPAPVPSPAPTVAPPSFTSAGGTLLLGSLLLVGLLYAAARLMRRMPIARFLPSADGPIRIASRTHLGARESLCLVDVGTTTLLLAVTGQSIQTLHVWPDGVRTAPASSQFTGPGASPPVPGQLRALAARLSGGR